MSQHDHPDDVNILEYGDTIAEAIKDQLNVSTEADDELVIKSYIKITHIPTMLGKLTDAIQRLKDADRVGEPAARAAAEAAAVADVEELEMIIRLYELAQDYEAARRTQYLLGALGEPSPAPPVRPSLRREMSAPATARGTRRKKRKTRSRKRKRN